MCLQTAQLRGSGVSVSRAVDIPPWAAHAMNAHGHRGKVGRVRYICPIPVSPIRLPAPSNHSG